MTQAADPLQDLRGLVERAKKVNLSVHELVKRAQLPVGQTTFYRWLNGGGEPGAMRLLRVTATLRQFLKGEEARLARGARTLGGPLDVNEDQFSVTRCGVVVPLKGQELQVLQTLMAARRPCFADWLSETSGVSRQSLARAISELRKKLAAVDFEIVTIAGRGGEPSSYALSDKAASEAA